MIGKPYENVAKCVISVSISLRFKILFLDYVIFIKILYLTKQGTIWMLLLWKEPDWMTQSRDIISK